ncbi:MAG: hypothetical protein IJ069_06805 [Prevotella sp.]|nr:hypothetical protein [Prevotella sp.]
MNTTISIPQVDFQRAKALADERHITISELFVMLINNVSDVDKMTIGSSENLYNGLLFDPYQCSQEDLNRRFDEIERELDEEEGIPHEQMMDELRQEFTWLK